MKRREFEDFLHQVQEEIFIRLDAKGREHVSEEQFHNFIEGAKRCGTIKEDYLLYLNTKHEVSRDDLVRSHLFRQFDWDYKLAFEKIHDILAYNILLLAMIYERTREKKEEPPF